MSEPTASAHGTRAGEGDDALHVHQGTLRGYLTGFVLAAILTIIPFWLVMGRVLDRPWLTISIVLLLAIAQILVHITYFLHLDVQSEGGWNMLAFIFTMVLVVIVLGASIWVMYNENTNMMPMSPQYHHRAADS